MKKLFLTVAVVMAALAGNAQESKDVEFSAGADVVNKYVWRGANQAQGAAIQPSLGVAFKNGLSVSAWGSTGIANPYAYEFDLSLGYSIAGVSLALTDYFWDGHYTGYGYYDDAHHLELSAGYTLPSLPLTFSAATMIAFNDPKITDPSKNNYSTYISAAYDFTVGDVALTAAAGVTPWGSTLWGSGKDEFEVADISLKAAKELKISDSFSVPVFVQAILAPATEGAHLVFGFSF
jgi:hypothetical protein